MTDTVKIVLLGESGVGKTCIISQFISGVFNPDTITSLSAQFITKTVEYKNLNKKLKFEIWDTAGQERFRSLAKIFYRDAKVIFLVYDITSKKSFEELKNYWVNQVLESSIKKTLLCIIANKSDLINLEQVDEGEARNYAETINALYFVVSAKDSTSINEMFKEIGKKYSGANSVNIEDAVDDDENMFEIKKIRKGSVKVTKAQALKKKKNLVVDFLLLLDKIY